MPDGISEALGVTHKQERQWLKENKHLRSKQQSDESIINEAFVKSIEVSALTESDVSKVMGALMRVQDLNITQKLIERIYLTSDDSINSSIIRVHGYKTLSQTIKAFKDEDKELISKILIILAKWPKVTRNKISSSQIEDVVKDINTNSNDDNLKKLSSDLLAEWGKLQMAYRIPRILVMIKNQTRLHCTVEMPDLDPDPDHRIEENLPSLSMWKPTRHYQMVGKRHLTLTLKLITITMQN